jgi:5-methyltetrahydropteroyltriglutamate--homocysteine methyltransferase
MIMYGVIDLGNGLIETPDIVASRLREALKHIPASRLIAAPDCGMKYLPRQVAFQKLKALADGAEIVRKELTGV